MDAASIGGVNLGQMQPVAVEKSGAVELRRGAAAAFSRIAVGMPAKAGVLEEMPREPASRYETIASPDANMLHKIAHQVQHSRQELRNSFPKYIF